MTNVKSKGWRHPRLTLHASRFCSTTTGVAAAKKKTLAAKRTPAKEKTPSLPSAAGSEDDDDFDDDFDDDDDGGEGGERGEGGGGKTDVVRRQRRMLSNRESARRSRRRKLEHVATLDHQIAGMREEHNGVLLRLRESEQRCDVVMRENAVLKNEVERLHAHIRDVASAAAHANGKMERSTSLQRISSAEHLAKHGGGDDSPRGFVPFRSLQSYENLLSLQAQAQAGQSR